jgi:hypothetical protein
MESGVLFCVFLVDVYILCNYHTSKSFNLLSVFRSGGFLSNVLTSVYYLLADQTRLVSIIHSIMGIYCGILLLLAVAILRDHEEIMVSSELPTRLEMNEELDVEAGNGPGAECCICKERKPVCLYVECGHRVSCAHCTNLMMTVEGENCRCPICRNPINRAQVVTDEEWTRLKKILLEIKND